VEVVQNRINQETRSMSEKTIPAALLKLVTRPGAEGKAGARIREEEVLDWRESDTQVVVVTTDGQKYSAQKAG
jgi:hypothetical protein